MDEIDLMDGETAEAVIFLSGGSQTSLPFKTWRKRMLS
jgi:hypothetical protein